MKTTITILATALSALLLSGCEYDSPITTEHTIPVNSAILGIWEEIPEQGKDGNGELMTVLQYSETEYLIHHPSNTEDGIYYRGYLIQIRDIQCMQLEVIGTAKGPLGDDEDDVFHVAAFQLNEGILEVSLLSTKVISKNLVTSDELKQAILGNIENKELFEEPVNFRSYP